MDTEAKKEKKPVLFSHAKFKGLFKSGRIRDVPLEKIPEGWSKAAPNPMRLLAKFKHLKIAKGLILHAYQYQSGGNGNGLVFAMPRNAEVPDPCDHNGRDHSLFEPPLPVAALSDFMKAVEGDGTPESYVSASIFRREASELGAMWHGCEWSTHSILFTDPFEKATSRRKKYEPGLFDEAHWKWKSPQPNIWTPAFQTINGKPVVTFHTYSGLGRDSIVQHTDRFAKRNMSFKTNRKVIALGPGGIVF
jgi:hypothetical protein